MWRNTSFLHTKGRGGGAMATSQARAGGWLSNTNLEWTAAPRARCLARLIGSENGVPIGLTSVCVTRHGDVLGIFTRAHDQRA